MVDSTALTPVAIFALGEVRFALSTHVIERVIRAVEISPMADPPPGMLGVINVHGSVIPVLDIRSHFGVPPREIALSDHFVIVREGDRVVAVVVEAVMDIVAGDSSANRVGVESLAGIPGMERIVVRGEEIVPVHDLSRFLPPEPRKAGELKLVA
jgi:purine-binding chemotaxis protein CheW